MATYEDFSKIEILIGTVLRAEAFPQARKPAYRLWIDFGEHGIKKSSAQITRRYRAEGLVGRQVAAVTNFPARKVASFSSQVLVLGAVDWPEAGEVILLEPDAHVAPGTRVL